MSSGARAGRRAHRNASSPVTPASTTPTAEGDAFSQPPQHQPASSASSGGENPFGIPPPIQQTPTEGNTTNDNFPSTTATTGGATSTLGSSQSQSRHHQSSSSYHSQPQHQVTTTGGASSSSSAGAGGETPSWLSFGGGGSSHQHHHHQGSSVTGTPESHLHHDQQQQQQQQEGSTTSSAQPVAAPAFPTIRPLRSSGVDVGVETAPFLTIQEEVAIAAGELRELDEKISATHEKGNEVNSKISLVEDEMRIKKLSASRALESAKAELDEVRTVGEEYKDRKLRQLADDRERESEALYKELVGLRDQRRARETQKLSEDKSKLTTEVATLTEKRDLLESANEGVNESAIASKVRKAKTVSDKIHVASSFGLLLAQQLKKHLVTNVADIVRGETGQAFVEIRKETLDRRQQERSHRSDKIIEFQDEAVKRSQELFKARDAARQRRNEEHQKLLAKARERAVRSTSESTQQLLDQVRSSHEEAMRKFETEFEGQHQHLKQMHQSIIRDDVQLDDQKFNETRQRFETHRKMAKELLESDVAALEQAKQRESQFYLERSSSSTSTASAGSSSSSASTVFNGDGTVNIAATVGTSVTRGTTEIRRQLSSLTSTVRSQATVLEKQASLRQQENKNRKKSKNKNSQEGEDGDNNNDDNNRSGFSSSMMSIEERAVINEIRKQLSTAIDKRANEHKNLENCISGFLTNVGKCADVSQTQRNEARSMLSQANLAQQQWDAELRRMMNDFSIVAAASSLPSAFSSSSSSSSSSSQATAAAGTVGKSNAAAAATTPVGFLLTTLDDCVERFINQISTVRSKITNPLSAQKRLLSAATKEDAERTSAHQAIDAKVMKIFQMFETADATTDSIRQREDEVRVEEISLQVQQRQLAEERRHFAVKCQQLKRALEQTEAESSAAQEREREARKNLADSERQLASLAIEQRTLLARATAETGYAVPHLRSTAFVDPMNNLSYYNNNNNSPSATSPPPPAAHHHVTGGSFATAMRNVTNRQHHQQQQQQHEAATAGSSSPAEAKLKELRSNFMGGGSAAQQQQHKNSVSATKAATAAAGGGGGGNGNGRSRRGDDDNNNNTGSGGTTTSSGNFRYNSGEEGSASPSGFQADVSASSQSTAGSEGRGAAIGIYGLPISRGAGISSMAAAVSPPNSNLASSSTTTGRY